MRQFENLQLALGQADISAIWLDPKSRDDIPQILRGLQQLHGDADYRRRILEILERDMAPEVSKTNGRPGMDLWQILVAAVLRANLNCDYDRLHNLVNEHMAIREMLGLTDFSKRRAFALSTLKDNLALISPELAAEISAVVVGVGHEEFAGNGPLKGRCDSFVVETNVHYPTDLNLLFDSVRKIFELLPALCVVFGCEGWRKHADNLQKAKRLFRKVQKVKHSTSKTAEVREKQQRLIVEAYEACLDMVSAAVERAERTVEQLRAEHGASNGETGEVERFIGHAKRQIDLVRRRKLEGETIPHDEKIFSVFEEHTEWIVKGKAGVPMELGLRVCILEDQFGFILGHLVMQQQTDDKVAVSMIEMVQANFAKLRQCSFDKGFHSPENQRILALLLDFLVLPKKGKPNLREFMHEHSEEFIAARHQHSAVESAINALEVHGLDRCPDHGLDGFKRYVGIAVLGRNIQHLGAKLRKRENVPEDLRKAA